LELPRDPTELSTSRTRRKVESGALHLVAEDSATASAAVPESSGCEVLVARNGEIGTRCRRRLYAGAAERQVGFAAWDLRLRRTRRRKASAYIQPNSCSQFHRYSPPVHLL
jgi:hypothetical protein